MAKNAPAPPNPFPKKWPANAIVSRALSDLVPYARNARTHSKAQIKQVAESMREWGWTNPILIDENSKIIAGHARCLAAAELGFDEVPCIVAEGWTVGQKKAYVIADNKLAMNAGWDLDLLGQQFAELQGMDFSLDLTGFPEGEISTLIAAAGGTGLGEDDVLDAAEQVVSALGDVWLLGEHRLVCGDATDAAAVAACLAGATPHLMVTDPPYGVGYDPGWREKLNPSKRSKDFIKPKDEIRRSWDEAWQHFGGDVAYIWCGVFQVFQIVQFFQEKGWEYRNNIIWVKPHILIGRGHYHWKHEPCLYLVRKRATAHWVGGHKQSTVWEIPSPKRSNVVLGEGDEEATTHATQKPVEAMRRPMENNSKRGDAVYEPFCGSGSTIIAAEMTGRVCHAIELIPKHCDISIRRWQNFTGKTATKESDGTPFPG